MSEGLFTRNDCDCDSIISTNGFHGIQFKCLRGTIATATINPTQLISCDK